MLKRNLSSVIDILLRINVIFTFLGITAISICSIIAAYDSLYFRNAFLIVCLIAAVGCFLWVFFIVLCLIESIRIKAEAYYEG